MNPRVDIDREEIRRALERWQAGVDREASFRTLVESYYRPVRFYFAKRGFSAEDARDLTQETFLGIYKGLKNFRHDARFDTWLYQIAANTCRKAIRNRHAQKRRMELEAKSMTDFARDLPADSREASSLDAFDALERTERNARLRRAVAGLPVKMRTCLAMRIYQDLSYREIASAMRLSVETVKAHLYQARQRLKNELQDRPAKETRSTKALKEMP